MFTRARSESESENFTKFRVCAERAMFTIYIPSETNFVKYDQLFERARTAIQRPAGVLTSAVGFDVQGLGGRVALAPRFTFSFRGLFLHYFSTYTFR